MPTFNNDFEQRGDSRSKKYAYDEMFEQAEISSNNNKSFQDALSQLKHRDDSDTI